MEKTMQGKTSIDYSGLFREIDGIAAPANPESFIKDVTNWVPLPPEIRGKEEAPKEKANDLKNIARESSEIAEKRAILDALSKTEGNVTKAARLLGISRATLQTKMKAYGLRGPVDPHRLARGDLPSEQGER